MTSQRLWLLAQDAGPNRADPFEYGCPSLCWAAFAKRRDIAEMLVADGATLCRSLTSRSGDLTATAVIRTRLAEDSMSETAETYRTCFSRRCRGSVRAMDLRR
jgi:hypothetical protein